MHQSSDRRFRPCSELHNLVAAPPANLLPMVPRIVSVSVNVSVVPCLPLPRGCGCHCRNNHRRRRNEKTGSSSAALSGSATCENRLLPEGPPTPMTPMATRGTAAAFPRNLAVPVPKGSTRISGHRDWCPGNDPWPRFLAELVSLDTTSSMATIPTVATWPSEWTNGFSSRPRWYRGNLVFASSQR